FVSVASGHLTLLAVGQVLQRSLEPARLLSVGSRHNVLLLGP
ncbi:acyltransferase, partial [Bifidobacterium longum]